MKQYSLDTGKPGIPMYPALACCGLIIGFVLFDLVGIHEIVNVIINMFWFVAFCIWYTQPVWKSEE